MTPDPARSVGDQPTILPNASVGDQPTILPHASVGELVTLTDPASTPAATPVLAPPGYVIEKELGRGGMGIVYLARQAGLNRPVALKMILGEAADGKSLIRFLAEAEAVAAIRHPNVVQVYQYGEAGGRPFLALEYLPGGSLADRQSRERQRPVDAATTLAAIADGVQAAHALGIVHRDLKPQNVLLDVAGVPKVTDFGLAKRDTGADLTNTNAIIGTPAYMAPEQAKGETKFVGPEADVWALGVILYEMLTGAKPFTATNPWLVMKQVTEITPASVRSLSGTVPRDLELICEKCLSKEKAGRYAMAGELAADLRRFLAGEPILARPVPGVVKAWKWAKRNRAVAGALAAAVLALVAGSGVSLAFAVRASDAANRERDRADGEAAQRQRADDEAAAAKASDREARRLVGRMAVAEGLRLSDSGDTLQALAWYAEPRRRVPEDADTDEVAGRIASYRQFYSPPVMTTLSERPLAENTKSADGRVELRKEWSNVTRSSRVSAWDIATGRQVTPWTPTVSYGGVTSAFSLDGRRLAVFQPDNTTGVWDTTTGQPIGSPLGHSGSVSSGSLSLGPDGRFLATVSNESHVWVWDVTTGRVLAPPLQLAAGVQMAAVSPNGSCIVTTHDLTATVWATHTGQQITPPIRHTHAIRSVSFSPDGRRFATVTQDRIMRVWDANTGLAVTPPIRQSNWEPSIIFQPDGRRLVTAIGGLEAKWDVAVRQPVVIVIRPDSKQLGVGSFTGRPIFSPDGNRIATLTGRSQTEATARLWDSRTGRPTTPPLGIEGGVGSMVFSPDGRWLAAAGGKGAQIWDTTTGLLVFPSLAHDRSVVSVAFSSDSRRFATAWRQGANGDDGRAQVWDATTGQAVSPQLVFRGSLRTVHFTPDGSKLAMIGASAIRVCDATTGLQKYQLTNRAYTNATALSLDGKRVATSVQKSARVWDMETGQALGEGIEYHQDTIRVVSFSPDGRLLLTASYDGVARVWDAATGQPATPPLRHGASIVFASFSPDSRRVATAGSRSARVWDAATGQPVTPSLQHNDGVWSAMFSPDSGRLVTGDSAGVARVWGIPTDNRPSADLIDLAHLYAGGKIDDGGGFVPLTVEETRKLFAELKAKYPADFTVTPPQAMAWHREQLDDAERDKDWFAVAFHLRVLLREYAFADVELAMRLRAAEAKLSPREVLPRPR